MTELERLPARMDRLELQIVQLRTEVHDEFSALRSEMAAGDEQTRRSLRDEMRTGHVMIVTALTEQIEESRRHTRVLFEEALSRLAAIQEGMTGKSGLTTFAKATAVKKTRPTPPD